VFSSDHFAIAEGIVVMRSRQIIWTILGPTIFAAALAAGCVTSGDGETTGSEVTDPESVGEENVPVTKSTAIGSGPIEDIDLKEVVYQGVEKQLVGTENELTRVEIGDFESFKFNIVRMSRAGEDVTNISSEQPDRLVVEASGWYKRSGKTGDAPSENCFSFESTVHLNADADSWVYDDKEPLTFSRENSEDCF
jgi:hypothetical protein